MPTPTGTIGLSDVNAELNLSPTALITMNDAAVRTLAGVPSGVISMNNLRGKSNRVAISLTISGNTNNYDVYANRGPTYAPGTSDITVTINPGVTVSSTSTGSSAFLVPSAFSPGDTVTVINNGTIVGRGGNGGNGGPRPGSPGVPGTPGGSGGPGLNVQRPVTIQNNNRVAGGGGGGGGGAMGINPVNDSDQGGGGGGGGVASGSGGTRGTASGGNGTNGTSATLTTFGPGGSGAPPGGGPGGNGGTFGSSGSSGGSGNIGGSGGSGGSSGAAVTGNPFITWNPTGTRNGPIS